MMIMPSVIVVISFVIFLANAENESHLRNGRALGGSNKDGTTNTDELEYPGDCIPFESDAVQTAPEGLQSVLDQTVDSCVDNDCPGGCCRYFNYLECDETNNFYWLRVSHCLGIFELLYFQSILNGIRVAFSFLCLVCLQPEY